MPYYIYEISSSDSIGLVKNLQLLNEFKDFKAAKAKIRELRAQAEPGSAIILKLMFADNQLLAEEQLLEKRDKPILMEHEK